MGWEEGNQLEERQQPVEQATRRVQPGSAPLMAPGKTKQLPGARCARATAQSGVGAVSMVPGAEQLALPNQPASALPACSART